MPFFSKDFSNAIEHKEGGSGGGYLNPSAIPDKGSIRFAILSESPLEGVEVWFTKAGGGMTKRITPEWPDAELLAQLEKSVGGTVTERDGRKAIKRCTAFFVYDYEAKAVKVFSANQKTLLQAIERLTSDEDYANLGRWDMKISRTGTGTDTQYYANMVETRRFNEEIAKAVLTAWDDACKAGADLEALYDGGNPFGGSA